ncbi:uncharacterized protein LOC108917462 [Anoplophora glabripennis]|uniref:uncharacterized protein LOC108917462 n=1 Tax=Anoplophora glabripennis TaxID=217634 RepID=UPI0008739D5E|nr:uncharacterized protein LOC108917462 [Anoplophora glabripennis]
MAHGLNSVIKRSVAGANCKTEGKGIGSRRIFAPHFKLQVLDSYRNDADCKGNQRATARKYGIHRRQIQKWLQVENTLRSSVSAKEKSSRGERGPEVRKCDFEAVALSSGRQRDDEPRPRSASAAEQRVPALAQSPSAAPWTGGAPLPLDFTTHSRGSPPSPADPSAPMDLSFKRPTSPSAPASYAPPSPPPPPSASPSLARPHPDVWDLSTKSLKRKCDDFTSPKPVKLFKPYLDDVGEECPASVVKLEPAMPCCSAAQGCEAFYYNNNNNNVVCDIKADYNTYTLLELQPKSAASYYYHPSYPSYSPGDYEIGGNYCGGYEDVGYGQGLAPLKQRQSYSLDFKLSAIDCYYQDSVCKGNQRAVATKYNVHRRQIQKWLKQAEELRLRDETMKQMHTVR